MSKNLQLQGRSGDDEVHSQIIGVMDNSEGDSEKSLTEA